MCSYHYKRHCFYISSVIASYFCNFISFSYIYIYILFCLSRKIFGFIRLSKQIVDSHGFKRNLKMKKNTHNAYNILRTQKIVRSKELDGKNFRSNLKLLQKFRNIFH